jgi:phage gp45-like
MTEIGRITGGNVELNRDSDTPGRVLNVELTDPNDVQSCELFTQAGDDTNPPDGSMCVVVTVSDALKIVIAVVDGLEPDVEKGEREFYSQKDGQKKARLKLTLDGKVIHNDGDRLVARKDDETESNITIDETFWTWINAVAGALGITPAPPSLTSKISEGTDEVLVP